MQRLEHQQNEIQTYFTQRKKCFDDLALLRAKLKLLIDANEQAPDDEQLDIEEFDLDTEGSSAAKELAAIERKRDEEGIREECAKLAAHSEAIKAISWNLMDVKGRNIRGIFTKLKVENYSLLYPDKEMEEALNKVKLWRSAEDMVATTDSFKPWIPMATEDVITLLSRKPHCRIPKSLSTGGGDSNESVDIVSTINQYTLTGTSSHSFIHPIPIRYSQLEVITYYQMHVENILGYVSIKLPFQHIV